MFYTKFYTLTIQESTESSKQPIRTRYFGHVTSYQPISDQYFLLAGQIADCGAISLFCGTTRDNFKGMA